MPSSLRISVLRYAGFFLALGVGLTTAGCTCSSDAGAAESKIDAELSDSAAAYPPGTLILGGILDFTGALAEHGPDAKLGAQLAVEHVNRAGGVLGQPVQIHFMDGATDADVAVDAARQLIVDKKIHALVGPMGSQATLAVAERMSAPHGLPTISPSATAPELTTLDDGGFVFRATASDAAQGPVLARLARDEGYERIAVIYRNDAYGRGLYHAFADHFDGQVDGVSIDPERESFKADLEQAAARDAQALLVLSFPLEAGILVNEAIELNLFHRFLFADGVRSLDLLEAVGEEALEGMKGTSPALRGNADIESRRAFLQGFQEIFGRMPRTGPAPGTYDAVICLALAVEHAGRLDNVAIRDSLPVVCGGDGLEFTAGAEDVAAALDAVRAGHDVNYDGAASTVDWNTDGDVIRGLIDVWQYQKGTIASLEQVPFELGG